MNCPSDDSDVTNTRPPVTMGPATPGPSGTDQRTFSVVENVTGGWVLSAAIPLALGPRNWDQSSAVAQGDHKQHSTNAVSQAPKASSRISPLRVNQFLGSAGE